MFIFETFLPKTTKYCLYLGSKQKIVRSPTRPLPPGADCNRERPDIIRDLWLVSSYALKINNYCYYKE